VHIHPGEEKKSRKITIFIIKYIPHGATQNQPLTKLWKISNCPVLVNELVLSTRTRDLKNFLFGEVSYVHQ
jgi:hypothetical protein